jgi:hypothetical protein
MIIDEELTILESEEDWKLPQMERAVASFYWATPDPDWIVVQIRTPACEGEARLLVKTRWDWLKDMMRAGISPAETPYPFPEKRPEFSIPAFREGE